MFPRLSLLHVWFKSAYFQRLKALTPEENTRSQHGLFFQDGQRRVDYVLTYFVKKSSGSHSTRQSVHLLTENVVTRSFRHGPQSGGEKLRAKQTQRTKDSSSVHSSTVIDMELGCSGEIFISQEDQKAFRREEFEGKLRDMGLELEKDEDVSSNNYLLQKLTGLIWSLLFSVCFQPSSFLSVFLSFFVRLILNEVMSNFNLIQ